MKTKQKRLLTISYMIVIFLLVAYTALNKPISNLDEIWNFNIAKEIAKGGIAYKDISLITTPLFYYIAAIPLVCVNELIVYRVLEAVVITIMMFLVIKIFQKINKNDFVPYVLLSVMILLINQILALNYNFLLVLWVLLIINLEISEIDKNKNWYNLLIGFIAGISILTKQTIGSFIAVFTIILVVLDCNSKKDIKQSIKNIGFRILGIIIPVGLFVIYLLATNSLNDFINYTILSINTFNNKITIFKYFNNSDFKFKSIQIGLYGLSIVGIVYIIGIRLLNRKPCRVVKMINYAIPLMILIYPIADDEHFILAFFIWAIIGLIEIANIFEKTKNIANSKILDFGIMFLVTFITLLSMYKIVFGIYTNMKQYNEADKNTEIKYYRYLNVSDFIQERVKTYSELYGKYKSEGKELNILDAEAAVYLIPTDSYRKNFDMFNKGNLGKEGEDGIIEQIKENKKQVYLVKPENQAVNWQTPKKVIEYIRKNLEKKETVLIYEVYE